MRGAVLLIALTIALSHATTAKADDAIILDGNTLRFDQVFGGLDLPERVARDAAGLRLAILPPGARTAQFSRAALVRSARLQMPVLTHWLPRDATGTVRVTRTGTDASTDRRDQQECVRIETSVTEEATVLARDVAQAPCPATHPAAFSYDGRSLRARRDLVAGEVVASPGTALFADVAAGQPLLLTINIGRVSVRREVEAVQAGREGRKIFVRGGEAAPFSIMLSDKDAQ